jgi:competence ComEA-like helix-hairpin-helix protein
VLEEFHRTRWRILAESGADLLACETLPSRVEIEALLALVRTGAERWGEDPPVLEPGPDALDSLLQESEAAREEEKLRSRPLEAHERLDPNRSPEEELDRLPGVGPAVAKAIVAHREARGRFRSPGDLLEVRGIGPATLERILWSRERGSEGRS